MFGFVSNLQWTLCVCRYVATDTDSHLKQDLENSVWNLLREHVLKLCSLNPTLRISKHIIALEHPHRGHIDVPSVIVQAETELRGLRGSCHDHVVHTNAIYFLAQMEQCIQYTNIYIYTYWYIYIYNIDIYIYIFISELCIYKYIYIYTWTRIWKNMYRCMRAPMTI